MNSARPLPPRITTPTQREDFFRHLLSDSGHPVQERLQALLGVLQLMEREAFEAGIRARDVGRDSTSPDQEPFAYRTLRVAWDEWQRQASPPGRLGEASLLSDERLMASYLAATQRNSLEAFHKQFLSDAAMMVLNPLLRNAAFTGLHAARTMARSQHAHGFVDFHLQRIPDYWEAPQFLEGYLASGKERGEVLDER